MSMSIGSFLLPFGDFKLCSCFYKCLISLAYFSQAIEAGNNKVLRDPERAVEDVPSSRLHSSARPHSTGVLWEPTVFARLNNFSRIQSKMALTAEAELLDS